MWIRFLELLNDVNCISVFNGLVLVFFLNSTINLQLSPKQNLKIAHGNPVFLWILWWNLLNMLGFNVVLTRNKTSLFFNQIYLHLSTISPEGTQRCEWVCTIQVHVTLKISIYPDLENIQTVFCEKYRTAFHSFAICLMDVEDKTLPWMVNICSKRIKSLAASNWSVRLNHLSTHPEI